VVHMGTNPNGHPSTRVSQSHHCHDFLELCVAIPCILDRARRRSFPIFHIQFYYEVVVKSSERARPGRKGGAWNVEGHVNPVQEEVDA
jgi:hypothetical protein